MHSLARSTEDIERLFREAEVILLEGRAFFTKANLELMTQLQLPSYVRIRQSELYAPYVRSTAFEHGWYLRMPLCHSRLFPPTVFTSSALSPV